jgi:hypothetical protein
MRSNPIAASQHFSISGFLTEVRPLQRSRPLQSALADRYPRAAHTRLSPGVHDAPVASLTPAGLIEVVAVRYVDLVEAGAALDRVGVVFVPVGKHEVEGNAVRDGPAGRRSRAWRYQAAQQEATFCGSAQEAETVRITRKFIERLTDAVCYAA